MTNCVIYSYYAVIDSFPVFLACYLVEIQEKNKKATMPLKALEGVYMNNKIKLFGIIAMLAVISVGAFAQQYEDGGNFQVDRVGNGIKIWEYLGTNTVVNIPLTIQGLPVTIIGAGAFSNQRSLTSVTIPNSVTTIENLAFAECQSLTSIIIPNRVTKIEEQAFRGCLALTSVTFQGTIPLGGFHENAFFRLGDLRTKFYTANQINGTPGTFTREPVRTVAESASSIWTKR